MDYEDLPQRRRPGDAALPDVPPAATTPAADVPPLVSVEWLLDRLGDPSVVPVEVGTDALTYHAEGHIPGAVGISWLDELHDPDRRGVLSHQRLEQLLSSHGITRDTHLVLYGDEGNLFAAYAYWVLRYYQHPRLSLLDGGRQAWVAAGAPLSEDEPQPAPGARYVSPGADPSLRATREDVLQRLLAGSPGVAFFDCWTPAEFHGAPETALDLPVLRHRLGGHIPGARNLPPDVLLDPVTRRLRPLPQLREALAEHVEPGTEVVTYCDVGDRSSLMWFAVHELLGHARTRNYDGGWSEYGSLVGAPVTR